MDRGLVVVREVEGKTEYLVDPVLGTWTLNAEDAYNCSPTDIGLDKARKAAEIRGGRVEFEPYRY